MRNFFSAACAVAILFLNACSIDDSAGRLSTADEQLNLEYGDEPFWDYGSPADSNLNTRHSLYSYYRAARIKKLPVKFFRELISEGTSIAVKKGDWPRYKPGIFYGGTIYHPAASKPPVQWNRMDWQAFYNELFHAWWQHIFNKKAKYQGDRTALFTVAQKNKYIRAHNNHRLAQEEAYSETIATISMFLYPTYRGNDRPVGYVLKSNLVYDIGKTVAPVGHSENSGYKKEAEHIFPDQEEYRYVFRWLTGTNPPESN